MANETVNATVDVVDSFAEQVNVHLQTAFEQTGNSFLQAIGANPWYMFIAIVILGFAASYLLVYLSKTIIKAFTRRTQTELDDILLERLQHPVALSLFLIALSIALAPLSLSSKLAYILNRLLISGNVLLVAVIVNRIFAVLVEHYGKRVTQKTDTPIDDRIFPIVRKMITGVVFVIGVLCVLSVWGIQIAPLLAGAGIAGIALAFSMQESLKNVFGGVSLGFDGAYGIGDRIRLADGTVGVVHDISLRSTKIRTFTGDLIVVPNGKIANEMFHTYAQPTAETAVEIKFTVGYGTDIDKMRTLLLEAIKDTPNRIEGVDRDTKVEFIEMGSYGLNCRCWFWVNDYTKSWDAKLYANRKIYDALLKARIEIPYPTQTILMKR